MQVVLAKPCMRCQTVRIDQEKGQRAGHEPSETLSRIRWVGQPCMVVKCLLCPPMLTVLPSPCPQGLARCWATQNNTRPSSWATCSAHPCLPMMCPCLATAPPLPLRTGELLGWSHWHQTFKLVHLLCSPLCSLCCPPSAVKDWRAAELVSLAQNLQAGPPALLSPACQGFVPALPLPLPYPLGLARHWAGRPGTRRSSWATCSAHY